MEPDKQLGSDLYIDLLRLQHKDLLGLQREITQLREQGADQEKINQRVGNVEEKWLDRINYAEIGAIGTGKVWIEAILTEQDRQAQIEGNIRDNVAMRTMNLKNQNYYARSNRQSGEPSARQEEERTINADIAFLNGRSVIQQQYDNLRGVMQQAVQDIRNGKEPDLSALLAQQMTKEQGMAAKQETLKDIVESAIASLQDIDAKQLAAEKKKEIKR